jgi:UrcA family protein
MTRFLPTVPTLTVAVFSISAFAAPAMADTFVSEPVTISYDITALEETSDAGVVLLDLRRQARDACTSVRPLLNTESVDEACVKDVVKQAVEGINSVTLTAAYQQDTTYNNLAHNTYSEARS